MGGRLVSPTFVGRREALAAAAGMLRRTQAGGASHLLVGGEAEIGKTRFGEAAGDLARAQGFQVLRGGCVPLASGEFPYAPIIAPGLTNRQIAAILYISIYTAGIHVSRILGKLGVTSRTEAASKAYRLGIVAR